MTYASKQWNTTSTLSSLRASMVLGSLVANPRLYRRRRPEAIHAWLTFRENGREQTRSMQGTSVGTREGPSCRCSCMQATSTSQVPERLLDEISMGLRPPRHVEEAQFARGCTCRCYKLVRMHKSCCSSESWERRHLGCLRWATSCYEMVTFERAFAVYQKRKCSTSICGLHLHRAPAASRQTLNLALPITSKSYRARFHGSTSAWTVTTKVTAAA